METNKARDWASKMAEHRKARPGFTATVHGFHGKDDQTQQKEIVYVIALDGVPRLQLLGGTMESDEAVRMAMWVLDVFQPDYLDAINAYLERQ